LLALIRANSVAAVANSRTMAAATSGKRRGFSTVGCCGQVTITTAGMSSASISSIVRVVCGDGVLKGDAARAPRSCGSSILMRLRCVSRSVIGRFVPQPRPTWSGRSQRSWQLAAYIDRIAHDQGSLFRMRTLGLIPTDRVRKQARELCGEPEREPHQREESANAIAISELLADMRSRFAPPGLEANGHSPAVR